MCFIQVFALSLHTKEFNSLVDCLLLELNWSHFIIILSLRLNYRLMEIINKYSLFDGIFAIIVGKSVGTSRYSHTYTLMAT